MKSTVVGFILSLVATAAHEASSPVVEDVIHSINKTLTFMKDNSQVLVPDLLYGIVLARGQIHVLRRHLESGVVSCYKGGLQLLSQLYALEDKCDQVLKVSKGNLQIEDNQEMDTLVDVILQPSMWEVDQPLQVDTLPKTRDTRDGHMTPNEIYQFQFVGLPDEKFSDHCISQLLGGGGSHCAVPDDCWHVVMHNGSTSGYPLTHRLLYVQVARQAGCKIFGSDEETAYIVKYFCGRILADAQLLVNLGFPVLVRDLFSEQVALCGMEGFTEYMRLDWLKTILSWQRPVGCFGDIDEIEKPVQTSRRKKRDDGLMAHGCFMHFTGVSIAAISTSLRLLVQCTSNLQ